jgi:hypothetical protein
MVPWQLIVSKHVIFDDIRPIRNIAPLAGALGTKIVTPLKAFI